MDAFVRLIEDLTPYQLMLIQGVYDKEESSRRLRETAFFAETGLTEKQVAEAVANSEKTLESIRERL